MVSFAEEAKLPALKLELLLTPWKALVGWPWMRRAKQSPMRAIMMASRLIIGRSLEVRGEFDNDRFTSDGELKVTFSDNGSFLGLETASFSN